MIESSALTNNHDPKIPIVGISQSAHIPKLEVTNLQDPEADDPNLW